jgi:putative lipoic acid-binding regulatory protein
VAGEANVRARSFRSSGEGKYVAYRFEVYHERFEDIEQIYRLVAQLDGTRFML